MALLARGFSDPAFEQGGQSEFDRFANAIWDSLREQCCATKPATDATCIVQLRNPDLIAALGAVNAKFK